MAYAQKNTVSTGHTGNLDIPFDTNRTYFFVVMTTAAGTVEFGGGGGLIPLAINQFYEPSVCPISAISIVTTGDYVLHIG